MPVAEPGEAVVRVHAAALNHRDPLAFRRAVCGLRSDHSGFGWRGGCCGVRGAGPGGGAEAADCGREAGCRSIRALEWGRLRRIRIRTVRILGCRMTDAGGFVKVPGMRPGGEAETSFLRGGGGVTVGRSHRLSGVDDASAGAGGRKGADHGVGGGVALLRCSSRWRWVRRCW